MLVQKKGITKKTKNLLIILGSILILGGGYFAYNYFATQSSSNQGDSSLIDISAITVKKVKTNLDTDIFDNPQFQALERDQYEGFVDQLGGISLSNEKPIAITNVSVKNTKSGSSLIIFWRLPEFINFNKVIVYRSTQAGQRGEEITSVDILTSDVSKVDSFKDVDLNNGTRYYYLVEPQITDDNTEEKNNNNVTLISSQQVYGEPTDEVAPASPNNVQVIGKSDGEMEIFWMNPDDEDLAKINIYRSSVKGTLGNIINVVTYEDFDELMKEGNILSYVDSNIKVNEVYYYTVTSEDFNSNESTTDVLTAPYKNNFYNPFKPLNY